MGPEAAMIQGGFGLLGGLIGMGGAQQANATAAENFRNQLEHNYFMSSTAHQREVQDLKAAGLNPILSAGGSGAAVGGAGSAPTVQNTMEPLVSSAMKGLELMNVVKSLDQADAKIENETKLADAQVFKSGVEVSKIINDMYMDNVKERDTYENWKNWITNRANTQADTKLKQQKYNTDRWEELWETSKLDVFGRPAKEGTRIMNQYYDWSEDFAKKRSAAIDSAKTKVSEFAKKLLDGSMNMIHSAKKGAQEIYNNGPGIFPYSGQ